MLPADNELYENVKDDTANSLPEASSSMAERVNTCVWFHTLYGGLDGLSVSYSTLKFFCDVSASSQQQYHEHLDQLLTDPEIWLPLILLESLLITGLSLLGNRASKKDKVSDLERFLRDAWPYIRDVLKGVKNGYKGIKGLTYILNALDLIGADHFRQFALPVGLVVGTIGMINRLFNRYVNNKRKALLEKNKDIQKEIQALNDFLQARQLLEIQLTQNTLGSNAYEHYKQELDALIQKQNEKDIDVDDLFAQAEEITNQLEAFEKQVKYKLLYLSSFIGGVVDGPYLFAGVMGLAAISGPMLIATSAVLAFMLLAVIAVRLHDEYEKRRIYKLKTTETKLSLLNNKMIKAQNTVYKLSRDGVNPDPVQLQQAYATLKNISDQRKLLQSKIYKLQDPAYTSSVLLGVKDGLTAFGALSGVYFAAAIFCILAGHAFPPALIIAGAFLGLLAMGIFTTKRIIQTHRDKKNLHLYRRNKKSEEDERVEPLLGFVDCNTDGFTRGEFYFQQTFEVVRSLSSGPYKSNNLTEFMLSTLKEENNKGEEIESWPMFLFWGAVSIIYGLCLAIRAYGQNFSTKKKIASSPEVPPSLPDTFDDETGKNDEFPPLLPSPKTPPLLSLQHIDNPDNLHQSIQTITEPFFISRPQSTTSLSSHRSGFFFSRSKSLPANINQLAISADDDPLTVKSLTQARSL